MESIYEGFLSRALSTLDEETSQVFRTIFLLSYEDLKRAEVGNPIEHHLIVLEHMICIAKKEKLNLLNGGAIAILHDISPVEKIRVADVETEDDGKEEEEIRRRVARKLHMREGSGIAQRKLLLTNDYFGTTVFSEVDIDQICEVIRIHDNPSLPVGLPLDNKMALSFREADRLWMLSQRGFAVDLERDKKKKGNIENSELVESRLEHVLERYHDERYNCYPKVMEGFVNNKLFFRTDEGYRILCCYVKERIEEYNLERDKFIDKSRDFEMKYELKLYELFE